MSPREAVVAAGARTPIGKAFRGSFNLARPDDLAAHAIREALARVPALDPAEVEDVVAGCAFPGLEQGHNVARVAALRAGLPVSAAAATVNRFCASGLQAVATAAHAIVLEGSEAAVAGGVESVTRTPMDVRPNPWVLDRFPGYYMVMGETAEIVARRYGVPREVQDEFALESQRRTAAAAAAGRLAEEIAPIRVERGIADRQTGEIASREEALVERDECNRPDTTIEGLRALKPAFDRGAGDGSVTAGNACQLSDGAAAVVLMERARAEALGVRPLAVFRGFAVAGCEPDEMGVGPVFAVPKLLKRHGLSVGDVDLWELNEAFAVQVLYCRDRLGIDPARLNVNGGAIALGHPYGMTGARQVLSISLEMRRRKARYGVVTMCVGGGQGAAGLLESCP